MNLLISSIGSLSAKFIIEECKSLNVNIFGTDINEEKYLINAKKINAFYKTTKSINSSQYFTEITEIIKERGITHIIPLTDLDVDFFSEYYNHFEPHKVKILVENQDLISILRNKEKVYDFFKDNKIINCIPTYNLSSFLSSCNQYPAIGKIKNGRSSENLFCIENEKYLALIDETYIIQPKIPGDIITVDIISDIRNSAWIQRREIFRTKNGAGITVEIINNSKINNVIKEFLLVTNYFGVLNIEFIINDHKIYLMDVNPRFSAGVAFSNFAGYNFVTNAIKLLQGEPIAALEVQIPEGLILSREYQEKNIN
jgi:carbamoyl-phosphate synthase large subunit